MKVVMMEYHWAETMAAYSVVWWVVLLAEN
jgi:hypothetical protein